MKRTGRGFTIVELVVVLLVTTLVAAMAYYSFGTFVQQKAGAAKHVRSLAIALQQARMRALAGKTFADITQHQSSDWEPSLNTYKTVRFMSTNHGFDTGDYVTFAGLTGHTGMNGGTYRVTKIDANTFSCPFYHPTSENISEPAPDPVTKLPPYPKARNLSQASKLRIMKLSNVLVSTDSVVTSFRDDPKNSILKDSPEWALISQRGADYYIYKDEGILIRNRAGAEDLTIAFDSRGFAFNDGGYEVWVDAFTDISGERKVKANPVLSVSPFGIVAIGKSPEPEL